jgi:flavin reductase (DIM6/NTAB) family NADH-FMN oxidoreductase RutF
VKQFNILTPDTLPSRYRANLINSCTGYKSLNLIGTQSKNGSQNLAIFNSIIHLGSQPALIGFTTRPLSTQRDTYDNIRDTGVFTVNHVQKDLIAKAHQTAAKYPSTTSEFEAAGLTPEYLGAHKAPFVKESTIKYSCTYVNEYEIKENGCIMIVGAIQELYVPEQLIATDGWINLVEAATVAGIGLDGYVLGEKVTRYEYAQPHLAPKIH